MRMQKEADAGELGGAVVKTKVKVGDYIEFTQPDEQYLSGPVVGISTDQWKMIKIDYNVPGRLKILSPSQFMELYNAGRIKLNKKTKGQEESE
jgi:hypothetical protein